MPSLKEDMMLVHKNTDFVVNFAGVTKPNEFKYTHGGKVTIGLEYHIHYTNDKREVFMTGGVHNSSSKIIEKVNGYDSLFSQYTKVKYSEKKEYPKKFLPSPTDSDYKTGTITRYFTQKANDLNSELFEISEEDFNRKNNLFRYFELIWRVSGNKIEVSRDNLLTMETFSIERGNDTLNKILYPLQLWKPDKDSYENTIRKLARLKNNIIIPPAPPEPPNPPLINPRLIHKAYNPILNLENVVRDENGNPIIGFLDGTRVDLTGRTRP